MGTASSTSSIISLPKGGGALSGMGEKFSPDLHTGTGNFTVPIALPPGRNGLQPQLNLVYSTGNGNGPYGLGWTLSVPGICRKTSKGIPRYDDTLDIFVLSGAEDLVALETKGGITRYRPRTEGLFARIFHHHDATDSYWEVRSTDGLSSLYGTPASIGVDPAVVASPADRSKAFAWKLTQTEDSFGNRIQYDYERDSGEDGPHHWDQLYLSKVRYADYGNDRADPSFLVSVELVYEQRPDPHSEYRPGFELRTRRRCSQIVVRTHADTERSGRTYDLIYLDQRPELKTHFPVNRVSLLSQVWVTGHDGDETESMPPLEFAYTRFEPEKRKLFAIQGADLPASSLANPNVELVDLFGNGVPDLVELNGTARYWRNLGNGRFDLPRFMHDAPAGLALADTGVQFIDANGDGRTDLLVTAAAISGYFPLTFDGRWDQRSFQRYRQAPSFDLEDPEVKLVDLDGDGVTDAIRSGSRFECFFNDPKEGWNNTRWVERRALDAFPNVNFSDPRVRWADMSGDGLHDIFIVHDGNVEYWPNFGHGDWGKRIHMANSPQFPYGYDPRRILVGDVDGDGLADVVYVDYTKVTLWINQSGNAWSDPITIAGTPPVSDIDAVRLVDLLGNGISGLLWSRDADGSPRDRMIFLNFTGGSKPYLLHEMDNHIGAVTRIEYWPSTRFYLEDQKRLATRWRTTLPFPVQVVACVEVIDHFSRGKLTTEYRYHHGYWDGAEREFRGFGMVEQLDTESFEKYDSSGLHGAEASFAKIDKNYFSAPLLTKTWFHQGPAGEEFGDWRELDWSADYWAGDPPLLAHTQAVDKFLGSWPATPEGRRVKRDALRALRGSVLRTELYALDGSDREDRPYTVSESAYGLIELEPPGLGDNHRAHLFFPHSTSQRTTQSERGDDPMTQFTFLQYTNEKGDFDPFGRPLTETSIACPRGWRKIDDRPAEPYLAAHTRTLYSAPDSLEIYIHDRVAATTAFEITDTRGKTVTELAEADFRDGARPGLRIDGQTLHYYDGPEFVGLPLGRVGDYGAAVRSETLVLTDDAVVAAYGGDVPPYLAAVSTASWTSDYPAEFRTLLPPNAGYAYRAAGPDPHAEPGGWFAETARRRYDFQSGPSSGTRGLVLETRDALWHAGDPDGHHTTITYDDEYDLVPVRVTDAVGLAMTAEYDYRVLQPRVVVDPNGAESQFTFTPLGFLSTTSVRGRTAAEGDQARPGTRLEYAFTAYDDSPPAAREPIQIRTIRNIHHDTDADVPLPERDEAITTVEYSDGFGRLLQTRVQGEDVRFGDPAFGGGAAVSPADQAAGAGGDVTGTLAAPGATHVVVSGWKVYDNKGREVEAYEPFFSVGWDYARPRDAETGRKVTTFWDPLGRAVRVVQPDATEQRVVLGVPGTVAAPDLTDPAVFEPTPWEAYTYDANDNAGRTHAATSVAYRHHYDTPASIRVDARGRTVEAVVRHREAPTGPTAPLPPILEYRTRTAYDSRSNPVEITDPLGRVALHHSYDLANRPLKIAGVDMGVRVMVYDAGGGLVERRDVRGAFALHAYDALNRPIRTWARDAASAPVTLVGRSEYGDGGISGQASAERAAAGAAYCLGRLRRQWDGAGRVASDRYDFKGAVVEKTRRVVADSAVLAAQPFRPDWENPAATPMEADDYTTTVRYDALGRVRRLTLPQDIEGARRALIPRYNRTGALESVGLERPGVGGASVSETYVERIAYDAKGQRVLIVYGNQTMTRYAYDPDSRRLVRLRTERFARPADRVYRPADPVEQDLAYSYDPAGNILLIKDRAPGSGIPNTPLGRDALDRAFSYDPLYRLRTATGRECDAAPLVPWEDAPRCTDPTRTRAYTETYRYDPLGSLEELKHHADGTAVTRTFAPATDGNRLQDMTIKGATTTRYEYDANGNMASEALSRHFDWDYADRLQGYRTQAGAGPASLTAQYLYDAAGQRVKKVVKAGAKMTVTVYLDGILERRRRTAVATSIKNDTVHVMDDRSRIALIRLGPALPGDTAPAIQYHLSDHLGSSHVVLDEAASPVSREEYTPYGESAHGGHSRKRYRYSGKERDEESGLSYFGFRYYAPWIARWVSCDPAGAADGPNIYQYVKCNPLNIKDLAGLQGVDNLDGGAPARPQDPGPAPADAGAIAGAPPPEEPFGFPPPPNWEPSTSGVDGNVSPGTAAASLHAEAPKRIEPQCLPLPNLRPPIEWNGPTWQVPTVPDEGTVTVDAAGWRVTMRKEEYEFATGVATQRQALALLPGLAGMAVAAGVGVAAASARGSKSMPQGAMIRFVRGSENAYSFTTEIRAPDVSRVASVIEAKYRGAAIYIGSGGHGTHDRRSFVTDPTKIVPEFFNEDLQTIRQLQDVGIARVLNLADPKDLQIFLKAEQMAQIPGQDYIFTIRAWCYSCRTGLYLNE